MFEIRTNTAVCFFESQLVHNQAKLSVSSRRTGSGTNY